MGVWLKIIKSSSLQWVRHWKWFQLRGPVGSCRLLSHVWATLKVADSLPQFHCLILLEYLCICSRKKFAEYWQFILSSWKNDPNKNPRLKHARMNIHSTWALSFCGHNRGKKNIPLPQPPPKKHCLPLSIWHEYPQALHWNWGHHLTFFPGRTMELKIQPMASTLDARGCAAEAWHEARVEGGMTGKKW